MARTKVVEQKKNKTDQRSPGAGKAAKTLMMKKNLEAKSKDVVKKAPRHRHGVARAKSANRLNKNHTRVFQRAPVVALVRQIASEIRPETRLSRAFVTLILDIVENEGLEVAGVARILSAKDKRATTRASDLLAALMVARSGMFDSPSEIRALMIRALCNESVHYCFDPETGATLIQPWKVQSFTNQERDPLNVLRSVEWRVTWPQGLTLELLVFSVKLSMSSSYLYSPERQRRIVQRFMASIDQSREPLTRSKQRLLMTTIAKTANDPEATLPKGYLARLLAMTEEEVERELKGADDDDDDKAKQPKKKAPVVTASANPPPPPLSAAEPAESSSQEQAAGPEDEEEDF